VDLLGGFSRRGSFDGVSTGLKIGSAINRTIANSRMRKRLEEEQRIERERLDQTLANPPPVHGSAKWATASELAQAGLLQPLRHYDSPSSLLLGSFRDPELANAEAGQLHWDGEGHLLTVAPTRSGKSTTTIVPNLVRYKGSCVVLDPKGELYRDTAAWRRHNVGPVYRIAPFEKDTDSFNPLLSMSGFSDARMLADLIMPVDPRASDFFRKDALAILSALLMYVAEFAPPDKRTLAEVRAITAAPVKSFGEALRGMATCGNPSIANAAQIVLGKNPERSLPALRETLNTELSLWDDPGIQRATSTNTVDFRSLKDTPATVYVTVPFPKMEAYAAFLKITLTTALEAMLQN
jgi:type IV secretion system protein VirD4